MAGRRKICHINNPWTSYYHRQLIIGSLLIKIYFVFYQIEKSEKMKSVYLTTVSLLLLFLLS